VRILGPPAVGTRSMSSQFGTARGWNAGATDPVFPGLLVSLGTEARTFADTDY
jgi:hypothetical protein